MCYMPHNLLIAFAFLILPILHLFHCQYNLHLSISLVIFAYIFVCGPFFFLLEQNFKISKTGVAKISFAFRSLKSKIYIWTYYVKDIFPLGPMLQNCCFSFQIKYLYTSFSYRECFFFVFNAASEFFNQDVKHYCLSYVTGRHFRLAIFSYKLLL